MPYRLKRYFLFLSLLLTIVVGNAQTTLDSLKNELAEHTSRDTLRIKTLINTSAELTYSNPEAGFTYVDEALALSQETNWIMGEALALRQKGNLYYVQADNLRALDHFQKALRLSAK